MLKDDAKEFNKKAQTAPIARRADIPNMSDR